MLKYIGKRLLLMIPTLLIVAVVAFGLIRLIPGGPALKYLGLNATPEMIENMNRQLGLDKPVFEQFLEFIGGLFTGNLGTSYTYKEPVFDVINNRMPVTVQIAAVSIMIAILIGVPLGFLSGVKHGSVADRVIVALTTCGIAMPEFWVALLLAQNVALKIKWFPTGGYKPLAEGFEPWLQHILLPAITLGLIFAAVLTRMTRSSIMDVLEQDYIKTARSKGQIERKVLIVHALRNALVPVITTIGISVCTLLGGAVLVEEIYSIPGIGRLLLHSIMDRDYSLFTGLMFYIGALVVIVNVIVDLIALALDPRIAYDK